MGKLIARILVLGMLGFVFGCGSAEVEYPDNPTPPPQSDPDAATTPAPGQGG